MNIRIMLAAIALTTTSAFCVVKNTQAKILHIEAGVRSNGLKYVILFLQNQTGDALQLANGLTNEPNLPFLFLADDNISAGDVTNRQFLLSVALTAYSTQVPMDFNWESDNNRIYALRAK